MSGVDFEGLSCGRVGASGGTGGTGPDGGQVWMSHVCASRISLLIRVISKCALSISLNNTAIRLEK